MGKHGGGFYVCYDKNAYRNRCAEMACMNIWNSKEDIHYMRNGERICCQ